MRHSNTQKALTGANILDAAERCFRLNGFGGTGVDGMAQEAGVTSGAFYKHFKSKSEAFDAAVVAGLQDYRNNVEQFIDKNGMEGWLPALVDYYLGSEHRRDIAGGCVVPGLTADVIRRGDDSKALYQEGIEAIADIVAGAMNGPDPDAAKPRAWATLALLAGGVMLSRAMRDETTAQAITDAVKAAALRQGA